MQNMKLENAKVRKHFAVKGAYRLLELECPGIGATAKPGQFVHLRIPAREPFTLRRPFSVFMADARGISILYKPVGRGTAAMDTMAPGDTLNLLGPLGNGFPADRKDIFPVLVGGGYGIAPLYMFASRSPVKGVAFVGGRSADDILCADEFSALGWPLHVTTEDGTLGTKGLVTEILNKWVASESGGKAVEIFACGPDGMLKAVGLLAQSCGLRAWLSLDTHMGCGVGACLACVCKIRVDGGDAIWTRVCKEGPVFECRQIAWDDEK